MSKQLEKVDQVSDGEKSTQVLVYRQVFDEYDRNKTGFLDVSDVAAALKNLGCSLPKSEIKKMVFEKIDHDHDNKITFEEFQSYIERRSGEFRKVYNKICGNDKCKHINAKHMRKFMKELDMEASDDQIRNFIQRMDKNSDGKVYLEEFQAFFALLPQPINVHAVFDAFQNQLVVDEGEYTVVTDIGRDTEKISQVVQKLLFGAIAGGISRTVTAPIDRLKILLQVEIPGSQKTQIWPLVQSIYRQGGYKAFFKGNGVNCIKIAPETSLKFFMFDFIKNKFSEDPSNITIKERFFAGGIAGILGQILIYPLEIAKTRMALSDYPSIFGCLQNIYAKEKIRGIYSGLVPSILGIFPYAGIDLATNSVLKEQASKYYQKKNQEPGIYTMLGCGMISSGVGMILTAPINIIRTRMQSNGLLSEDQKYKGALDIFRRTMKQEGFIGFYRGMIPAMCKVLPATSISYAIYGILNQKFNQPQ